MLNKRHLIERLCLIGVLLLAVGGTLVSLGLLSATSRTRFLLTFFVGMIGAIAIIKLGIPLMLARQKREEEKKLHR
jgi:NADH:ubiquinone oxidoreductase subunit K